MELPTFKKLIAIFTIYGEAIENGYGLLVKREGLHDLMIKRIYVEIPMMKFPRS